MTAWDQWNVRGMEVCPPKVVNCFDNSCKISWPLVTIKSQNPKTQATISGEQEYRLSPFKRVWHYGESTKWEDTLCLYCLLFPSQRQSFEGRVNLGDLSSRHLSPPVFIHQALPGTECRNPKGTCHNTASTTRHQRLKNERRNEFKVQSWCPNANDVEIENTGGQDGSIAEFLTTGHIFLPISIFRERNWHSYSARTLFTSVNIARSCLQQKYWTTESLCEILRYSTTIKAQWIDFCINKRVTTRKVIVLQVISFKSANKATLLSWQSCFSFSILCVANIHKSGEEIFCFLKKYAPS